MATENKTPNPFASLARSIETSRLGMPAAARNLSQSMNRQQFRSSAVDRSAPPAQVAAAGPVSETGSPSTPAQPDPVTDTAPAPTLLPNVTFAGLSALRQRPMSSSRAVAPSTARPGNTVSIGSGGNSPSGLKKASALGAPDVEDLVSEDGDWGLPSSTKQTQPVIHTPSKKLVYTPEQEAVISCDDKIIVVDAFAGCAKTTTAIGYAAHRPKNRMLYLCLNTANAEEAKKRFGPNVTAATTHSVAWAAMRPNKARVTRAWRPLLIMDQLKLTDSRVANTTMRVLNTFFNSSDTEISEKHAAEVREEKDLDGVEVMNAVAFASLAWKRMNDPGDSMQMPDDAYLKMFALKAPKLDQYNTIIFDEAQDANPVTAQIIAGQKHVNLLCIGDRHQSIYGFRGSVNAMEKFSIGAKRFHLSQTFRFGPHIAGLANTLLGEFKGEKLPIRGMGQDGTWNPARTTTLSRTNAELFRLAAPRRGEGVHWVGGKVNKKDQKWIDGCESYRLDGVLDAYHLYSRDRTQIKDQLMKTKFTSWDDYVKYAEDSGDGEAKILVKVVEEFTHEVPQLIEDIKKNAVRESADADLTLTTVHKSKGLEWDCVEISDDFEVLEETEAKLAQFANAVIPVQDINLLYVGMTRAKSALKLNKETKEWLEKLPEHRKAREAAVSRHRADNERVQRHLNGLSGIEMPNGHSA